MADAFDPYHKWLGIPPKHQPPNHYRLLGLELFESDPDVIDAAAAKQAAYLQGCATGPHVSLSQKLLNEISAARLCLLDKKKREAYDAELRKTIAQQHKETAASQDEPLPEAIAADLTEMLDEPLFAATTPQAIPRPTVLPTTIPLNPVGGAAADPLADLAEFIDSAPKKESQKPKKESRLLPAASTRSDIPAVRLTKPPKKSRITLRGLVFRIIGMAIAGLLAVVVVWLLNSYFHGDDQSKKEVAQVKHTQKARKSEVKLVDKRAQSATSKSPVPKKPFGQADVPMLERSSDPSPSAVNKEPVTEEKPSVDSPPTDEKPATEKTLLQEEQEFKAAFAAAKSKEDDQEVAEKGLAVADRAIVEGNADMATTAVRQSLVAARNADDGDLTKRATQLLIQLQSPLSEAVKDEARKRLGADDVKDTVEEGAHSGFAKEKPGDKPATASPDIQPTKGWVVIFCSSDPSIWNSATNTSPNNFALPLAGIPDDVHYLRMQAPDRNPVIIPMTKGRLNQDTREGRYGWSGDKSQSKRGWYHIGIYDSKINVRRHHDYNRKPNNFGRIYVDHVRTGPDGCGGWGFGSVWGRENEKKQAWSWEGYGIPMTVIEIAVKPGDLDEREEKYLLDDHDSEPASTPTKKGHTTIIRIR